MERDCLSKSDLPWNAEKCVECCGRGKVMVCDDNDGFAAGLVRCDTCSGRGWLPGSPVAFPAPVVSLAESLYAGEDCAFALHDALLDAGQEELARHFAEKCGKCGSHRTRLEYTVCAECGTWLDHTHPRGCWALDLILGKE